MSYQVLARKWRPKTFAELVGQTHVVDAISNALDNDKLHHAYLFTGTRGVGKTTIARIFAKSLNCETGQSANPCGQCATCMDINQGRYVDLLEIDAASRTKVEDTRELLDNVQYKPTRGRFKVYLIDEVHMLSKHSFNALLKTLEEPPEHVKFLLATTDPQKLPITVLSRCLQFNLKQLSKEQISEQLEYILQQENVPADPQAIMTLAKAANGSMRDALSLTDQAIAQGNNQIQSKKVIEMLGLIDKNLILKLIKEIAEGNRQSSIQVFEDICQDAPDFNQVLSQIMAILHQISLTQIVPDICKLETSSAKAIYVLSKALSPEQVQLLYQMALHGKRDLPHAPDPRTGTEMTLLRMLAFQPTNPVKLDPEAFAFIANKPEPKSEPSEPAEISHLPSESLSVSDSAQVNTVSNTASSDNPAIATPSYSEVAPPPSHDELLDYGQNAVHTEDELASTSQQVTQDTSELPQDKVELEQTKETMSALDDLLSFDLEEGSSLEPKKPEASQNLVSDTRSHKAEVISTREETETSDPERSQPLDVHTLTPYLSNKQKLVKASQVDEFSALVDELEVLGFARQMLLHAQLIKFDDTLHISLSPDDQHLQQEANINSVEEALQKKFNKPIKLAISIQAVAKSPMQIQQKIDHMRHQYAQDLVASDPIIQDLLSSFDASVIQDSIQAK